MVAQQTPDYAGHGGDQVLPGNQQHTILCRFLRSLVVVLVNFEVVDSKNPPAEPGALRWLAPQRGLIAIEEGRTPEQFRVEQAPDDSGCA